MRILNAIYAQTIGGVNQVFCDYAESLINNGHEVALLVSRGHHRNHSIPKIKKIYQLSNLSSVLDSIKLLFIFFCFKPDAIICHSPRLARWMALLKHFTKTKTIAVNHGTTVKKSLGCDFVISVNQEIASSAIKAGLDSSKSFVIPNAIKIDQKYCEKNLRSIPTIGSYGRIEMAKGFDILINACGLLKQKGYDFRLKIGGFEVPSDYGWSNLKQLIRANEITDKCDLVGVVTDKEKFFSDVDIFCSSSREESFGLGILEAFLHSALVISSDTNGGKLLIRNGENGLLFKKEDSLELAEKIIWIIENKECYSALTRQAFKDLENNYGLNKLAENLEKILSKISPREN